MNGCPQLNYNQNSSSNFLTLVNVEHSPLVSGCPQLNSNYDRLLNRISSNIQHSSLVSGWPQLNYNQNSFSNFLTSGNVQHSSLVSGCPQLNSNHTLLSNLTSGNIQHSALVSGYPQFNSNSNRSLNFFNSVDIQHSPVPCGYPQINYNHHRSASPTSDLNPLWTRIIIIPPFPSVTLITHIWWVVTVQPTINQTGPLTLMSLVPISHCRWWGDATIQNLHKPESAL